MDNASVSDRDIYMRAKLLIDEHGKDKAKCLNCPIAGLCAGGIA